MKRALTLLSCSLFAALVWAAPPQLVSVRLLPGDATIWGAKATQHFLVLGQYSDGLERDLTSTSQFRIADAKIAAVEASGMVTALADGQTTLTATVEGQSAHTAVKISGSQDIKPFSFAGDIGAIFTKRGCNSSDCHGSVKGKGGLKLSADARYPRDDYKWIVEGGVFQVLSAESAGPKVPRIDPKDPEKSLLLQKPTTQVAHGGGRRFALGSADYVTIVDWIRKGAPYGEEDGKESVHIARLEVLPPGVVLDQQGKQQVLVSAWLSNGRREDVTGQVLYVSNNLEVVKVSADGQVSAVKTGEAAVMIRAAGQAVAVGFGVISKPIPDYPKVAGRNLIDEFVLAKLRKFNIIPSDLSSDSEFLRRVCLDLAGTLPPPNRVREFLASKDPQKRDKVIEALLNSPEYVDYWTFRFADLFRVDYEQGAQKYSKLYWEWIHDFIERDRPYDEVARERIAGQGFNGPTRHYWAGSDIRPVQDTMSEQVRVFLGRRLDCAQCHNHPYESWSQNQYWGMAAFFGRLTQLGDLGGNGDPVIIDDPAGHGDRGQGAKTIHPRSKEEVAPSFLDGKVLTEEERIDLRMRLAEWMTSKSNPYFSQAIVNRMWSYFFSRGIVQPVDDFRLTNPPTHPELLDALSKDFRDHGHDLKRLIRLMVQSRTYQLSSQANATNQDDHINYSRSLPRALDAEVLLDAISNVSGSGEVFGGSSTNETIAPGTRAVSLMRPEIPSQFMEVYGRPNRLTVPQRKVEPNLRQALHMLAGTTYTAKLAGEGGRLDRLLKRGASDQEIIEEFWTAAISRPPTESELTALVSKIRERPVRTEALEDFVWALVSSRQFAYNH